MATIKLDRIRCFDETKDGGNSDEIYSFVFAGIREPLTVTVPASQSPTGSTITFTVPGSYTGSSFVHYFGKWGDFDEGEYRELIDVHPSVRDLVQQLVGNIVKIPIIENDSTIADDYFVIVVLMEKDESSISLMKSALSTMMVAFQGLINNSWLTRAQIVDSLKDTMVSAILGVKGINPFWNEDDYLGVRELRISQNDMTRIVNGETVKKTIKVAGKGYEYRLYFEVDQSS